MIGAHWVTLIGVRPPFMNWGLTPINAPISLAGAPQFASNRGVYRFPIQ